MPTDARAALSHRRYDASKGYARPTTGSCDRERRLRFRKESNCSPFDCSGASWPNEKWCTLRGNLDGGPQNCALGSAMSRFVSGTKTGIALPYHDALTLPPERAREAAGGVSRLPSLAYGERGARFAVPRSKGDPAHPARYRSRHFAKYVCFDADLTVRIYRGKEHHAASAAQALIR
jgi:hypothetical protein